MELTISNEDTIFFLDMIDSRRSPNFVPQLGKRKPYFVLMKDRNSMDYKRFITIYQSLKHILTERESLILDRYYGVNEERVTLKTIGIEVGVKAERVRQLIAKAEHQLEKEIAKGRKFK